MYSTEVTVWADVTSFSSTEWSLTSVIEPHALISPACGSDAASEISSAHYKWSRVFTLTWCEMFSSQPCELLTHGLPTYHQLTSTTFPMCPSPHTHTHICYYTKEGLMHGLYMHISHMYYICNLPCAIIIHPTCIHLFQSCDLFLTLIRIMGSGPQRENNSAKLLLNSVTQLLKSKWSVKKCDVCGHEVHNPSSYSSQCSVLR